MNCGAPFTPVVAGQTRCDRCQGLSQPEPRSPLQQAEVAGFKFLHELGAGRFSHSWLAEDARSHAVVVKLLRRYATDPNAVQRFLAEAERLAADPGLDHPNLAKPLSAGVHLVQALFLVYEHGGALTLADELRQRGRVPPARALELCAQICEGLAAAHRIGLVHRDLKPANVGLTRLSDGTEQAVVLDVATSHLLSGIGLREGGILPLSSAAYMSPEEAAGQPLDARSDLYGVGVLLFQLLSGRLPLMGASADELLRAHRDQPPLRLRDIGRRLHDDVEMVLAHLLAKDPAKRPATGEEAAVLLRAVAPVAEIADADDEPAPVDDPLLMGELSEAESEPPQMLPPAVDPGLERAMMGHVGPLEDEVQGWTAFVPSSRWRWAALAGAAAAVLVATLALRAKAPRPAPMAVPASARLAGPPPAPVQTAALSAPAPVPEPPAPSAKPSPSPYAKNFERAQKALWTNRPTSAEAILRDVLKKRGLSRHDRAQASKLMGEAEAKRGNRARAGMWWRKSLALYEEPEERARVALLLQGHR